jgi:hypothetical protein
VKNMAPLCAALFGMNLVSGLETVPGYFSYVAGSSVVWAAMVYSVRGLARLAATHALHRRHAVELSRSYSAPPDAELPHLAPAAGSRDHHRLASPPLQHSVEAHTTSIQNRCKLLRRRS